MSTRPVPAGLHLSWATAALLLLVLGGCRSSPLTPYAWKPTEEDPRLLIRVPEGTPGSIPVPREERLHRNAWATQVGEIETPDERWSCCPEGEEAEEWKRNEVSLFLGYTGVRAQDGATAGLSYIRYLRHNFGLLVFGEGVFGEEVVPVVGAGIVFKPDDRASILFAWGAQFENEEHHSGGRTRNAKGLMRFGATYLVGTISKIRICPAVYLDLVQDTDPVFLLGFEFGREF